MILSQKARQNKTKQNPKNKQTNKNTNKFGEMAQGLSVLAAECEDLSVIPRVYRVTGET